MRILEKNRKAMTESGLSNIHFSEINILVNLEDSLPKLVVLNLKFLLRKGDNRMC